MASLRDIRLKIRAIKNIQKITQAMKMVAAAKLKKVQDRVAQGRPYSEKMRELVHQVSPYASQAEHPLLTAREVRKVGLVVIAGDKGLCGSYNNNITRRAVQEIRSSEKPVSVYAIGRKSWDFFRKRGHDLKKGQFLPPVGASFGDIQDITRDIVGWFMSGEVDEVRFAYTKFVNVLRQEVRVVGFLPIQPDRDLPGAGRKPPGPGAGDGPPAGGVPEGELDYIFEPAAPLLLADLIPRFVENQIYHYLMESQTSEQGARMNAMNQATDNAGEIIQTLTRQYNKARQWAITKEMLEIVGGAEALKLVH